MINKALAFMADICGLKAEGERGYDALIAAMDQLNTDTKGAAILADSLLYDHYDDKTGIAFNSGSAGFWFEINPLVGASDDIEKNLTLFFNEDLPENGYLQFLIVASHDVNNIINLWEQERKYGGKALERLTHYRKKFIENCASNFSKGQDGRLARDYRSFITYASYDNGNIDEILKFQRKLANKLRAERLNPRLCKASDLISVGRDILQMQLAKETPKRYSVLNNISDQILNPLTPSTVEEEQIIHHKTGLVSRVYAPRELPESYSLAEMIKLLGDEYRVIPARFVISYSLANNLGAKGTASLKTQGDRVIHAASKEYTKDDLLAQEEV